MKLPEVSSKTFKYEFNGVELNFRKFKVRDTEFLEIIEKESEKSDMNAVESTFKTLAHFMEGYDATEEERFEYLCEMEWDDYTDLQKYLEDLMEMIGLQRSTKSSKKAKGQKTPKSSKK